MKRFDSTFIIAFMAISSGACLMGAWIGIWAVFPVLIFSTLTAYGLEKSPYFSARPKEEAAKAAEPEAVAPQEKTYSVITQGDVSLSYFESSAKNCYRRINFEKCPPKETVEKVGGIISNVISEIEARQIESREELDRLKLGVLNLRQLIERLGLNIEKSSSALLSSDAGRSAIKVDDSGDGDADLSSILEKMKLINQSAEKSSEVAQSGVEAQMRMTEHMDRVQKLIERTVKINRLLKSKTRDIGAVLSIINDVTEQTNLLALNAAIIAAQAGESGKGFGVVADEIRELAERTNDSTKEISGLIKSFREESAEAAEAIEQVGKLIHEGFDEISKSGFAPNDLTQSIDSVVHELRSASDVIEISIRSGRRWKSLLTERCTTLEDVIRELNTYLKTLDDGKNRLVDMDGDIMSLSSGIAENKKFVSDIRSALAELNPTSKKVQIDSDLAKELTILVRRLSNISGGAE